MKGGNSQTEPSKLNSGGETGKRSGWLTVSQDERSTHHLHSCPTEPLGSVCVHSSHDTIRWSKEHLPGKEQLLRRHNFQILHKIQESLIPSREPVYVWQKSHRIYIAWIQYVLKTTTIKALCYWSKSWYIHPTEKRAQRCTHKYVICSL